jgi:hypothetical protein
MRGPTSDRQHAPHLDPVTTTGSARIKKGHGVRAGRPRPADNTPQSPHRGARSEVALHGAMARQAANCRIWLFFQIKRLATLGYAAGSVPS